LIGYEQEFELYHYEESLCSQMVRIALCEKQLEWKSHPVKLEEVFHTGNNLGEYLKVNPKGRVPTLVHNGAPVYDSYHIIRYLDNCCPESGERLAPEAVESRIDSWVRDISMRDDAEYGRSLGMVIPIFSRPVIGRILKWQPEDHVAAKFEKHPVAQRARIYTNLRKMPNGKIDAIEDIAIDTLAAAFARIEKALGHSGAYLLGAFTQVDVMMMAHFHRLEDVSLGGLLADEHRLPHTANYWQTLQSRPSYAAAVTDWHEDHWRRGIAEAFGGQVSPCLERLRKGIETHLAAPA